MKNTSVFDNITGKRLAFLQNAYNIGYTLNLATLDQATFTLPFDDDKNRFCLPYRYVDIWDGEDFVGLFRILPSIQTRTGAERSVVYTCESVLATLMDDVLFGWHEVGNLGVYTQDVLSYVLAQQTARRWELAGCDFRHQFLYGWENENLLTALFSVPQSFTEPYKWVKDTSALPWRLTLSAVDPTPRAAIEYRKNMRGISKKTDPTNLCTRLYPLGYGEGDNQLNIADLNSGKKYLDADSVSRYGLISRIWVDRRYQDQRSLYDAAVAMLKELSEPYVSYTVDVIDGDMLSKLTVGDYVRVIDDEDGTDFTAQVITLQKSDVVGDNPALTLTIANKSKDVATTVADIADRTRIGETYAQGAVTVFTKTFADNADPNHPAVLRFDLPANIVHINEITLTGQPAAFRSYSLATGGGGAMASTTGSGGAYYTTSGSGGSSTMTSTAQELRASSIYSDDESGPGHSKHNHGIPPTYNGSTSHLRIFDASGNALALIAWVPSGAHIHEAHSHTVTTPDHTHSVSITSHTHSITIPEHTHDVTPGIYEGSRASTLRLVVDGREAGSYAQFDALNIIPFLSTSSGGDVTRTMHTVEIYPDTLSRIEVDMMIQLFANSRGGGQY